GPQSYAHMPHGDTSGNSPLALLSFAERSLVAGDAQRANALSPNPTEQNAFYGWPLVLLAFAIVVRLWGQALVTALAATAVGAALAAAGRPRLQAPRRLLQRPLRRRPHRHLRRLPPLHLRPAA